MLVKASIYEVTFEDRAVAKNCLQINAAYLNKVSTDHYVRGKRLFLVNQQACDPVIETEVSDVCGSVVSSNCYE